MLIGERLLLDLNVEDPTPLLSVALGVILLSLLPHIPCVGWMLGIVAASIGLGAVVLTRAGTVPYPASEGTPGRNEAELLPEPTPEPPADEPEDAATSPADSIDNSTEAA